MKNSIMAFSLLILLFLSSCAPASVPTPKTVIVTQEVIVTQIAAAPTPAVVVVTAARPPTGTPEPNQPTSAARSRDWVDYGGICLRPDNIPAGIVVNPEQAGLQDAHDQILAGLWRVIEDGGYAPELVPSFSNYSRFVQGVYAGVLVRGHLIPVSKTPPRSDPWSFFLENSEAVWRKAYPGGTFRGIDFSLICYEFISPFGFEEQKHLDTNPAYVHLVGGVTHAIFALDDIFGSPRLVIKLYQNPYSGKRGYEYLRGFSPQNSPEENAEAANQHVSALIATLNTVLWGNFDGDGVYEFGYGPANSAPLAEGEFPKVEVFVPEP